MELSWSKVSTKVCGFTFGSISLHLISKRIKEILTQNTNIMRNIYPDLMMKMFSGNTLSGVCVYMYVTFLVGEIVDRFLGRALYR